MISPDQSSRVSCFQLRHPVLRLDKLIPSDLKFLDGAISEITAALDHMACWDDVETIGLAVGEALANAMVHGNHCDPQKTVRISVAIDETCGLLVSVKDSGSGFDPSALPNPIAAENLLATHGRGIFLIRQLMDAVDFEFDHGTEIRMLRRLKKA